MKIRLRTGTPTSRSSRSCSTLRRGWVRNVHSRFWMSRRLCGISLGEIYFLARQSTQVGESKKYTSIQIQFFVWERCVSIQEINLNNSNSPTLTENYWESIENHSSLSGIFSQAAHAVSACTQVRMEDALYLLKILKSECPDIWTRLPKHEWPKSWSKMEDPVVPLERYLTIIL